MTRLPSFFILSFFLFFTSKSVFAQFPYKESFKNSTAINMQFGGAPAKAFVTAGRLDPEGDGYLRLTNSNTDQTGYVFSGISFPSKYGLKMELEYYIYGGNGADGITFFLFDASVAKFNPGAFGGSLGYAQKHDVSVGVIDSPGVSQGYLGIGLDEYGNFSNPTEGRQGGVTGPGPAGISPSSITLRGKGSGSARTADNYRYLTSVRTDTLGFALTDGVKRYSDPSQSGYRKVFIDLKPALKPQTGFFITVRIITGGAEPKTYLVINNFHYPDASPENLKYGIASSTGYNTNIHEVRNVSIDLFNESLLPSPVSVNDSTKTCFDQPIVIDILKNDYATNEQGQLNASTVDLNPGIPAIQDSYQVKGKGTFKSNGDGTITFTPEGNIFEQVAIFYTVKDTYNKISAPASITLNPLPLAEASAGGDQILFTSSLAMVTLNASISPLNSGIWSQLSGPAASISNKSAFNTSVTNLIPGTYDFQWAVTGPGLCRNTDIIRVIVRDSRAPNAVDDQASTTSPNPVSINILENDIFEGFAADLASLQILVGPTQGSVAIKQSTGEIDYSPHPTYSGKDSFTYTVKNTNGLVSNIARVIISIKPAGSRDQVVTPINTAVTIPVKNNDQNPAGTLVIPGTVPLHGSITVSVTGTITYNPHPDYSGNDAFTYFLRTADGIESDAITVNVLVNVLPVAADDVAPPTSGGPIDIDVTSNDTDPDGNLNKGTVIIIEFPLHGTVTVDPVTGKVRYVPNPGYSGSDKFTYIIKDDQGGSSKPGRVNISVSLLPKIGLAKAIAKTTQGLNGSYDVDFIFTVKNFGDQPLQNISLRDDLKDAFSGADVRVTDLKIFGTGLIANTAFDGTTQTELLNGSSTLAPGAIELVALSVNIKLISREGIFNNTAFAKGFSAYHKAEVEDQSTNGLRPDPQASNDVAYSVPTPLTLKAPQLFIPGGFSPNQDGINDLFVIQNKITKRVSVEIFNRWGNRIYWAKDYKNDWDGKCTDGIFAGEYVPAGTYYYIIIIDDTNKYAGYLTVTR